MFQIPVEKYQKFPKIIAWWDLQKSQTQSVLPKVPFGRIKKGTEDDEYDQGSRIRDQGSRINFQKFKSQGYRIKDQ